MPGVSPRKTEHTARDDNFARYYKDVGKTKILDTETERRLFKKYRKNKDTDARNRILESCLRFVVKLASRFTSDPELLKDLISAGNEGLLLAIDRFDPSRNTRFLSYATYWVLLYIRDELNNVGLVSTPLWCQKLMRKIKQLKSETLAKTGQPATQKQLCRATRITKTQLDRLQTSQAHYLNIDDLHLSNDGIESKTMMSELSELFRSLLEPDSPNSMNPLTIFSQREIFVVRAYYGFIGEPKSLAQIAQHLRITSERVRQIKESVLSQMQRILERKVGATKHDGGKDKAFRVMAQYLPS